MSASQPGSDADQRSGPVPPAKGRRSWSPPFRRKRSAGGQRQGEGEERALDAAIGDEPVMYQGEARGHLLTRLRGRPRVVITQGGRLLAERHQGLLGLLPLRRDDPILAARLDPEKLLVTGNGVRLPLGDPRLSLVLDPMLQIALGHFRPEHLPSTQHAGRSLVAVTSDGKSWAALGRQHLSGLFSLTSSPDDALTGALFLEDGQPKLGALLDDPDGTRLVFDDAHQVQLVKDQSQIPGSVFGRCTVPPRWVIVSGPTRIGDRNYTQVAFPVCDSRFEEALARSERATTPPPAPQVRPRKRAQASGLTVKVSGRLPEGNTATHASGRLVPHEQALALSMGKGAPIVLSGSRLRSAYVDGRFLFLFGEELGVLCELESVSAGLAVSLHPVVRRHIAELDSSASLLAAITMNGESLGVGLVALSDKGVDCELPGEDQLTLPFASMQDIRVADGEVSFAVEDDEIQLQAAEQEVRQLLDRLWHSDTPVPAKILLADFRHPEEREHFGLAQNVMRSVTEASLRDSYANHKEPAARPDLLGKALRVEARQLPELSGRVAELSALLDIPQPDTFVRDGWELQAHVEGWVHPRIEINARCLSVLGPGELDFHLARCCAHLALNHHRGRILGVEALRLVEEGGDLGETALESTGAWIGAALGTSVGLMAGGAGAPIGQRVGRHIGRFAVTMGASSGGVFDNEGEVMVRRAHLFRWLRTTELSADAFGYLFCGDLETAVRAVLLSVLNTPEVVDALDLPLFVAQVEAIESVEGPAALYSRLDEQLPYGPHRVAELLAYAASQRGVSALERMQRIRRDRRGAEHIPADRAMTQETASGPQQAPAEASTEPPA